MPGGRELLFTDTVGFIQKLPTNIIAAFRATLEEIIEADLLLHVVDSTHPQAAAQIESVEDILAELEVDHLPTIMALNKVDRLSPGTDPAQGLLIEQVAVATSALNGQGIDELLVAIEAVIEMQFPPITVKLPYSRGDLVSMFHERGQVSSESHEGDGVLIYGRLPERLQPYFKEYKTEIQGD
jgi:GTP-binding protein HflX